MIPILAQTRATPGRRAVAQERDRPCGGSEHVSTQLRPRSGNPYDRLKWAVLLVERLGDLEATTERRAARGARISNAKLVVRLTRIYARFAPREDALRVSGLGRWNRRDERLRRGEET